MDFAPPECHTTQSPSCTEADWVPCAECTQLICNVHDDPVPVRHAGKYAANTSNVCAPCAQILFERGEVAAIRNGYQFINRR
jgi:hypothetical protein